MPKITHGFGGGQWGVGVFQQRLQLETRFGCLLTYLLYLLYVLYYTYLLYLLNYAQKPQATATAQALVLGLPPLWLPFGSLWVQWRPFEAHWVDERTMAAIGPTSSCV
jgi:hypothetical protein